MSQQMQFDDRRERSPEQQEPYTPRQVNADPREQSQQNEPINEPVGEEAASYEAGYEPGYAGQRQREGEKLQPEAKSGPQRSSASHQGQSRRKRRGWLRPLIV